MKTLKFKTSPFSGGMATPQNPLAPIGLHNGVCTYEVTDIPENVSFVQVSRMFNATAIIPMSCYSVPFSACGIGHIYRGEPQP